MPPVCRYVCVYQALFCVWCTVCWDGMGLNSAIKCLPNPVRVRANHHYTMRLRQWQAISPQLDESDWSHQYVHTLVSPASCLTTQSNSFQATLHQPQSQQMIYLSSPYLSLGERGWYALQYTYIRTCCIMPCTVQKEECLLYVSCISTSYHIQYTN